MYLLNASRFATANIYVMYKYRLPKLLCSLPITRGFRNTWETKYSNSTSFEFPFDLLFAVFPPMTFVADTVIPVNTINALSINTWTWAALVNVHITMGPWKTRLTVAIVVPMTRLTIEKMGAVCCAHRQSCKCKASAFSEPKSNFQYDITASK